MEIMFCFLIELPRLNFPTFPEFNRLELSMVLADLEFSFSCNISHGPPSPWGGSGGPTPNVRKRDCEGLKSTQKKHENVQLWVSFSTPLALQRDQN